MLVVVPPAAANTPMSILNDEPATIRQLLAARPDGGPGLRLADGIVQQQAGRAVLPGSRLALTVSGGDASPSVPTLAGRSARGMAALLRDRIRAAGGHLVVVDDLGPRFAGRGGDDLASAMAMLSRERAWYAPSGLSRRVHLNIPDPGALLTADSWSGVRRAALHAGGLWLEAFHGTAPWTPQEWLTWPGELSRRLVAAGGSAWRVHMVMRGGADMAGSWRMARTGTACTVLRSGPGALRLGDDADAFVAEFRGTLSIDPSTGRLSGPLPCVAAPLPPAAAAPALIAAAARESAGLEIPPGGLAVPPLVAGDSAQLTVGLGPDPLGLAAALGVTPEAFWSAAGARLIVTAPGASAEAPVEGDGSARVQIQPTEAGGVTMRLELPGTAIGAALGGPVDLLAALRAADAPAALPRRVVADPTGWGLDLPLVRPGGAAGDPVLEVIALP